jgi:hypothetical protein
MWMSWSATAAIGGAKAVAVKKPQTAAYANSTHRQRGELSRPSGNRKMASGSRKNAKLGVCLTTTAAEAKGSR